MNMFARFDENPAMTLRVIKETKHYGRTHAWTDGQRENSIPPTNKVCGARGIINMKQVSYTNRTSFGVKASVSKLKRRLQRLV